MRRVAFTLLTMMALVAAACGTEIHEEVVGVSAIPVPSTTAGDSSATDDVQSEIDAGSDTEAEVDTRKEKAVDNWAARFGKGAENTTPPGSSKALVLAAVEKSSSGIDSLRMTMTMVVGGIPELGGGEAALVIEAAVADGGRMSEFSMDMSGFLDAILTDPDLDPLETEMLRSWLGQPIEFRVIGGTTYVSATLLSLFIPVETTWIAFESEQSAADFGVSELTTSPADFLALLRGVDDDAEIVGSEIINGVSTIHIHGSLSVLEAIAAAPPEERAAVEEALAGLDPSDLVDMSVELFDIDVWIGDDGLVRRMILDMDDLAAMDETGATPEGAYMRLAFEFSDYGDDVSIEEPAASDVTFIDESSFGFDA